ncbi:hypothetical protein [Gordonia sp. NPDC003376]
MTGQSPQQLTYSDELLADHSVYRRYSDGRQEWRRRDDQGRVWWRDDRGNSGVDEPLGTRIVKRTYHNGAVIYGRENGFGRTLWSDGILTLNRSRFGGRLGAALAAVAGGALLVGLIHPPQHLTPEQEAQLQTEPVDPGSGGGSDSYSSWDDTGDDDGGDFG